MPSFEWTITLGNMITIVCCAGGLWLSAVRVYHQFDKRLERFEMIVTQHAITLNEHTGRFLRNEEHFITLAGDMQRMIGRMNGNWDGANRREKP